MKFKSLILSLVLGIFALFSTVGLVGCDGDLVTKIKTNFEKLDEVYEANSIVFYEGNCEGLQTKYLVDYGKTVNGYVLDNKEGYAELQNTYNVILAVSNDCIDGNRNYILSFLDEDEDFDKTTTKALKALNKALENYIDSVEYFADERRTFVEYHAPEADFSNDSDNIYLRKFKRAYGKLVNESVALSDSVARCIESREFLELIQDTFVEVTEVEIVKEYIRAKMISVYSEMIVSKVENNLNWNAYNDVEAEVKERLDNILSGLRQHFENYKDTFIRAQNCKNLTQAEMKKLLTITEDFFVEAEDYFYALENFDIDKLVVDFDFDIEKYKNQDKLIEVYLAKIEQFIGVTLPAFTAEVSSIIY